MTLTLYQSKNVPVHGVADAIWTRSATLNKRIRALDSLPMLVGQQKVSQQPRRFSQMHPSFHGGVQWKPPRQALSLINCHFLISRQRSEMSTLSILFSLAVLLRKISRSNYSTLGAGGETISFSKMRLSILPFSGGMYCQEPTTVCKAVTCVHRPIKLTNT